MNKRKLTIGILAFSLVLLSILYALNEYEKTVCHQEDIDVAKHNLQVLINSIDTFHERHGRLPAALQDLVPEFIEEVPLPKFVEKVYYHVDQGMNYYELSFRVTSRSDTMVYYSSTRLWHQYRS